MTNEELVVEIQNGQTDLLLTLWEQNQQFISGKARAWKGAFNNQFYFDTDDLIQSGWLALVEAVNYYKDDLSCSFLTVYGWFLKKHFQKVIGIRSSKRDALFYAKYSLDSPLTENECDGDTFGDTIPDPAAVEAFEAVEAVEQTRIRSTLDTVAGELLNDRQWEVYQSLLKDIHCADITKNDVSVQRIYQIKNKVFRILRNDPRILQLWLDVTEKGKTVSEIAESYMQQVGVGTFRDRCASSVELAVEQIINNDKLHQNKARKLERMIDEKLHAVKGEFAQKKSQWLKQSIMSDLETFEQRRSEKMAEGF